MAILPVIAVSLADETFNNNCAASSLVSDRSGRALRSLNVPSAIRSSSGGEASLAAVAWAVDGPGPASALSMPLTAGCSILHPSLPAPSARFATAILRGCATYVLAIPLGHTRQRHGWLQAGLQAASMVFKGCRDRAIMVECRLLSSRRKALTRPSGLRFGDVFAMIGSGYTNGYESVEAGLDAEGMVGIVVQIKGKGI